jgi:hypothetical protein
MDVHHLTAGARTGLRLVQGDRDRYELVARIGAAMGEALLAYCVMDTHIHVVAEMPAARARQRLEAALVRHTRAVNARRGSLGRLLRGPVEAVPAPDEDGLARMIQYVHENPVRTRQPLVRLAFAYRWSSLRAYAGLSLAGVANVGRALALAGPRAPRLRPAGVGPAPVQAGLDRAAPWPSAPPPLLLAAAAETYGLPARDLPSAARSAALVRARSLFLGLGRLEGYSPTLLAPLLGRSRAQAYRLLAPVPERDVRIARTLMAVPEVRAQLSRIDGPVDETEPSHLGASPFAEAFR